jgi:DNA invertase Pin-like site-specific DNA recombinase
MARTTIKDNENNIVDGVIYARYSEGPNQTEASIEGQVRECREYAERNGIRIINVYSDSKHTGTNDNRVEFQKMLRDSKRGGFSVVVVWKIDRFGRNRAEIAQNRALLKLSGAKVVSAKEYIPDSPEGIILESVLEGMAEYYSANLAQNIKRGLTENALHCKSNGAGQSLGYVVGADKRFEIEPNEAAIVRMIFQKFDEGTKIADIWRELVASGIKTKRGKDFTQHGISRILSNRAYIGEYRYADIVTPGGMPRIIDDELFNRVQERRASRKKVPASRRSNSDVDFLLTGKVFCGYCKGTIRGMSGTGKSGNKFYYYACHNKIYKHANCNKKNVKKDWLETEVTRLTAENILTDEIIEYIADKVVEIQKAEQEDKSMLRYYEQQLRETKSALNNIVKAIEAGLITATTKTRLFELEEQKATLEGEIEREKIIAPIINKEQVIFFLKRFRGGDINDKDYQRQIIEAFVNKALLYDDKIIITYNISNDSNELSAEIVENAAFAAECECSSLLSSSPPFIEKTNTTIFFVGGIFGIVTTLHY